MRSRLIPLFVFSLLLVVLMFFIEPNRLLCASTISSGIVPIAPHQLFALALIPLFFALRSPYAFVLLAPSIIAVSMTPQGASLALITALVLFTVRFSAYLPFIVLASFIVLVLLAGLPLALLALLVMLIPASSAISSPVWRARSHVAWFALLFLFAFSLSAYLASFPLALFSLVYALPLEPTLLAALLVVSMLAIAHEQNANIIRSFSLLLASMLFAELSMFAMPIIVGLLASSLSLPEERLRGSRIVALLIVLISIAPSFGSPGSSDALFADPVPAAGRVIAFTPDFVGFACEGRSYPDRIDRGDAAQELYALRDPVVLDQLIIREDISFVIVPEEAPVGFAVEHALSLASSHEGELIVASRS